MKPLMQRIVELPFWLRALLFLAACAGLLFTGLRSQPIPELFAQEDKLHHFIGFFALAFSCRLAFLPVKLHWIAIGCVLAGVLIEYAQALIPCARRRFTTHSLILPGWHWACLWLGASRAP